MELLESIEVGSGGAATIEFTSIPNDGTDLVLLIKSRNTANQIDAFIEFNGLGMVNSSFKRMYGNGSTISNDSNASYTIWTTTPSSADANSFGNTEIYIHKYASSGYKVMSVSSQTMNTTTPVYQGLIATTWTNSAAISSIKLYTAGGNFAQYSIASLYKITKA